mgnify:CR=1 FL=1
MYRLFENGVFVNEVNDISSLWNDNLVRLVSHLVPVCIFISAVALLYMTQPNTNLTLQVTFLIGCSFSFEEALISNNVPMRHIDEKKNVPMYNTNIACRSAGCFGY